MYDKIDKKIVEIAKQWINTPFHAQGRKKYIGCDCIGLIIGIANELGAISIKDNMPIYTHDTHEYNCIRDSHKLKTMVSEHLREVSFKNFIKGNVLLYKFNENRYHVGIVSEIMHLSQDLSQDIRIIHSCLASRCVIEHIVPTTWYKELVAVYSFY